MGLESGVRVWRGHAQGKFSGALPAQLALIESILWEPDKGPYLAELHMDRLMSSAVLLGFEVDRDELLCRLGAVLDRLDSARPQKLRILLDRKGKLEAAAQDAYSTAPVSPVRLWLSTRPVDKTEWWLYHKTTYRPFYEHQKEIQGREHLLFYNREGFVTETDFSNIIVEKDDGTLVTPPITDGLLGGTMRAHLIETGVIREEQIRLKDLKGRRLFICNSVRKIMPAIIEA